MLLPHRIVAKVVPAALRAATRAPASYNPQPA
jgi:hypothetical protein